MSTLLYIMIAAMKAAMSRADSIASNPNMFTEKVLFSTVVQSTGIIVTAGVTTIALVKIRQNRYPVPPSM